MVKTKKVTHRSVYPKALNSGAKKVSKKVSKKCCDMNHSCWSLIFMKLSVIAFILFLITVWPGAMALVHNIHWGWFLGAMIVFCVIGCRRFCRK